jgi:hypothetical protein
MLMMAKGTHINRAKRPIKNEKSLSAVYPGMAFKRALQLFKLDITMGKGYNNSSD